MVSSFEEHKEILLYEQPDIDITTPWQWLRENAVGMIERTLSKKK